MNVEINQIISKNTEEENTDERIFEPGVIHKMEEVKKKACKNQPKRRFGYKPLKSTKKMKK